MCVKGIGPLVYPHTTQALTRSNSEATATCMRIKVQELVIVYILMLPWENFNVCLLQRITLLSSDSATFSSTLAFFLQQILALNGF